MPDPRRRLENQRVPGIGSDRCFGEVFILQADQAMDSR